MHEGWNISYSVCIFVALVIQHAKRIRPIILSSVPCLARPHFSPLYLTNGTILGEKLLDIKCIFPCSLQLLSETFLILGIIQLDMFINVHMSLYKVSIIRLKPTGYVMHHQINMQQLYALPTLYLCVLYLSENKQRLVPLTT